MLDLASYAVSVAERLGAKYAEARVEKTRRITLIMKNGSFEPEIIDEDYGIGIRVLNKGLAFASTNQLTRQKIKEMVKRAIRYASKSSPVQFSEEKPIKAEERVKDKEVTLGFIHTFLKNIDSEVSSVENIVSRFFEFIISEKEKVFVNSEGSEIYSKLPRQMLDYSLIAKSGSSMEQRYFSLAGVGGLKLVKSWNADKKLRKEAEALSKLLKSKKAKSGKMDVVLSPELVGIIVHESCGHPFEADRILGREAAQAGESYITPSWLGRKIGSEFLTIVEDPRIPNSYGFYLYDDEGVKARRRFLIKGGYVNEFLHNRETASFFGVKSNGSARASSYNREPIVRMSNTFILPGDYSFDELIEDIKYGVYIKSFTEWNIDDKRWNEKYVGAEAYEIVNGEIRGLIRRPTIETTTPKLFMSIDACGRDFELVPGTCGKGEPMQGVPVSMGGPHIRLRNMFVKGG